MAKVNRLSKQKSVMDVSGSNPLESGLSEATPTLRVENISNAQLISDEAFNTVIIAELAKTEDNKLRIETLEKLKEPYLFTSNQLCRLIELTESVRTRISFITTISPRLVDPKVKFDYICGLFRYADEKIPVETALKERIHAMTSSLFATTDSVGSKPAAIGALGGRGGRGSARAGMTGRGRGRGRRDPSPSSASVPSVDAGSTTSAVVNEPIVLNSQGSPGRKKSESKSQQVLSTPTGKEEAHSGVGKSKSLEKKSSSLIRKGSHEKINISGLSRNTPPSTKSLKRPSSSEKLSAEKLSRSGSKTLTKKNSSKTLKSSAEKRLEPNFNSTQQNSDIQEPSVSSLDEVVSQSTDISFQSQLTQQFIPPATNQHFGLESHHIRPLPIEPVLPSNALISTELNTEVPPPELNINQLKPAEPLQNASHIAANMIEDRGKKERPPSFDNQGNQSTATSENGSVHHIETDTHEVAIRREKNGGFLRGYMPTTGSKESPEKPKPPPMHLDTEVTNGVQTKPQSPTEKKSGWSLLSNPRKSTREYDHSNHSKDNEPINDAAVVDATNEISTTKVLKKKASKSSMQLDLSGANTESTSVPAPLLRQSTTGGTGTPKKKKKIFNIFKNPFKTDKKEKDDVQTDKISDHVLENASEEEKSSDISTNIQKPLSSQSKMAPMTRSLTTSTVPTPEPAVPASPRVKVATPDRVASQRISRRMGINKAAESSNATLVRELIDEGVDVNMLNAMGETPLHAAAGSGSLSTITALVEGGADLNALTKEGNTALMVAIKAGQNSIAEYLIDAGTNLNACNKIGETALILASRFGMKSLILLMLEKGADPDIQTKNGFTALLAALLNGEEPSALCLIDSGCDLNKRNQKGYSALMIACTKGFERATLALINKGAEINVKSEDGNTALMFAAMGGFERIGLSLVEKGANLHTEGKDKESLRWQAIMKRHPALVQSLHGGVASRESNRLQTITRKSSYHLIKDIPPSPPVEPHNTIPIPQPISIPPPKSPHNKSFTKKSSFTGKTPRSTTSNQSHKDGLKELRAAASRDHLPKSTPRHRIGTVVVNAEDAEEDDDDDEEEEEDSDVDMTPYDVFNEKNPLGVATDVASALVSASNSLLVVLQHEAKNKSILEKELGMLRRKVAVLNAEKGTLEQAQRKFVGDASALKSLTVEECDELELQLKSTLRKVSAQKAKLQSR